MSNTITVDRGVGVLGLLGVLFVGLKLGSVINWSWWYVTMPFWGGIAIVLGILAVVGCVGLIAWAINKVFK